MKYDWNVIQAFYDQGRSTRECMVAFGFTTSSWTKARSRGDFVTRPPIRATPETILVNSGTKRSGARLRLALIAIGRPYLCVDCGQGPVWNGKKLVLAVDHVDGCDTDHRPQNLEFRCPNCHSQTPTWGFKGHQCRVVQE